MEGNVNSKSIPVKKESEASTCKKEPKIRCDDLENEFVDYTMVLVPVNDTPIGKMASVHSAYIAETSKSIPKKVAETKRKSTPAAAEPMEVDQHTDLRVTTPAKTITPKAILATNVSKASATIQRKNAIIDDDVVMLLSDSDEEEDRDKSKKDPPVVVEDIEMIEKISNSQVLSKVAEKKASNNGQTEMSRTDVVESESNVITLDDSPVNSVGEPPKTDDSSNANEISADKGGEKEKQPEGSSQNALQLIEQLVEDCYQKEQDSANEAKTPITESIAPKTPANLTESKSKESGKEAGKESGKEKLPKTNSQKNSGKRECINFDCKSKKPVTYCKAPLWALNYFNVPRKVNRGQFICHDCFHVSVNDYERMCGVLVNQQPLLLEKLPIRPEVVEILDSDDEDNAGSSGKYVDDSMSLSLDTLTLLEEQLENTMKKTFNKINIENQLQWTNQILEHKLVKNEEMADRMDSEIKSLQKLADTMYEQLYKTTNFIIEELPPLDLNENKHLHMYGPNYPPADPVVYPPVNTHSLYYAVRAKLLTSWIPCKVTELPDASSEGRTMFKVRFLRTKGLLTKTVPGNQLAYGTAPNVRLHVGTRVIALFTINTTDNARSTFFPGIIAEPLQAYNNWRYLIFFDDGYAQYVTPDNVRLICCPSENVWEDVYQDAADFIKSYLEQYKTQRPMVQVKRGQRMITEWNSEWTHARVHDIDGSLVLMFFENAKRTEWIYRGSTRLGPLYKDRQLQKHSVLSGKRNEPFVEYMSVDDDGKNKNTVPAAPTPFQKPLPVKPSVPAVPAVPSTSQASKPPTTVEEKRSVARKSVTASQVPQAAQPPQPPQPPQPRPQPAVQHMNNATIYVEEDNRPKGKVVYYTAKKHMPPRKYVRHNCGTGCLYEVRHNLSSYSPLAKPLLSGWERKILKNKSKKMVEYRTPCGRNLRNMSELHRYLRDTKCSLNVDNFDFDVMIHCLAEYVIDTCIIQKHDLSDGCEPMVVPCVNHYDNTMPPPCVYSAKRVPNEGVNLNLDTNFMCGCDCEDDCMDKTKCQCWKLTLEGAQFGNPNTPLDQVGYEFKRLPNPVPTGIYECNSRCKCSKTCLNRVAQHPLQMKLQVFKTGSRGWGLRCLNDVPKGSFICVYAGDLLTEQNANIAGDSYGDEYFAELDYIEVVESLKEGYEPGVQDDDFDDDEFDIDKAKDDSDDDEYVASTETISGAPRQTRYNTRNSVDVNNKKKIEVPKLKPDPAAASNEEDEEDAQRQLISFVPNANSVSFENNSSNRYKSIRKFYGKNESVFIMDAKKLGNIGRYFNHSCSPNLFVQNVFVDTHDLRFPWVAFFALSHIRAGTELTWNYNYDVGSVPGKVMYCECGAANCRGRLL